ncbi:MAG: SGNH/GDSL hydrolase family protein [Bacteroidota bacterium]
MMRNIILLITLILLSLIACEKEAIQISKEDRLPKLPLSYLALGDSYTIGQGVDSVASFPAQLTARLRADSIPIKALRIVARTGWTTDELQTAIDDTDLMNTYDFVSLLIGVNNQFRGYSEQTYAQEFEALLQQAIAFARGNRDNVFVLSIPDYAFTPFGLSRDTASISAGIDRFNAINKNITETYGVAYYDITSISRMGLEQPDLVADDRLHPSGEQYCLWIRGFYDSVKAQLLD